MRFHFLPKLLKTLEHIPTSSKYDAAFWVTRVTKSQTQRCVSGMRIALFSNPPLRLGHHGPSFSCAARSFFSFEKKEREAFVGEIML